MYSLMLRSESGGTDYLKFDKYAQCLTRASTPLAGKVTYVNLSKASMQTNALPENSHP